MAINPANVILAALLAEILPPVISEITKLNPKGLLGIAESLGEAEVNALQFAGGKVPELSQFFDDSIGQAAVDAFIKTPLGISETAPGVDASRAFKTMARLVGFSVKITTLSAGLGVAIKAALGHRGGAEAAEIIARLPDEIGLPFFIGSALAGMFERAVGPQLEELVNVTYRPNPVDRQTARALFKQHKITGAQFDKVMAILGIKPEHAEFYKQLNDQMLTVGDLQQAALFGMISEGEFTQRLAGIGFSDEDATLLTDIYLRKAETQGGALYRTAARTAYVDAHISEAQFRSILNEVHVPPQSIDFEVAAVKLERELKRVQLTLSETKQAFQHGVISEDAARQRLTEMGYGADDRNELIRLWIEEGKPAKTAISEQRIAQFQLSGVLTQQQAYERYIVLGIKPADALLLAQNPSSAGSVFKYPLDRSTITSALKEQVISVSEAQKLLLQIGVNPQEAGLELSVALAQQKKQAKPKAPTKTLTVAEVEAAFKGELVTDQWAHRELRLLGYTDADAALLIALWLTQLAKKVPDGWTVLN